MKLKWLQNNLPGVFLAAMCGGLVLVAVVLGLAWMRPVAGPPEAGAGDLAHSGSEQAGMTQLPPVRFFREVNDRPLFSESRRPVIVVQEVVDAEPQPVETKVADAPKVTLTGVVITPGNKLVSLTPEGGGESVVFAEGAAMRGDYNGWQVGQVEPRRVMLQSTDGKEIELKLLVHDQQITQPPRPEPKPRRELTESAETEVATQDEDEDEPVSRAEEIRQRIAERREQLRQEAAANNEPGRQRQPEAQSRQLSPYQQAIQDLMKTSSGKTKKDDDNED